MPKSAPSSTGLRVPSIFSDGMVLQCDTTIPIWGWSSPKEKVTVCFAGRSRTTTADDSGAWEVRLDALPASLPGSPPLKLEVCGRDRIVVNDVLVGEVWLCSGQSNMEFTLAETFDGQSEVAAANHPQIRQWQVPRVGSPEPKDASFFDPVPWRSATPKHAGNFTAVGYFFARKVGQALGGKPVGLINSSWGGTAIQSWMAMESLRAEPRRYERLLAAKKEELEAWPARLRQIEADTREWEARAAAGQLPLPQKPWNPGPPDQSQWMPANLYNGLIYPLAPYAIRGALWYQGESNAGNGQAGATEYSWLLSEMIRQWRCLWKQGDFPFYFVQLPNWFDAESSGMSWAYFREGQARVLATPNTGMAVAIDAGDSADIHPPNKHPVGDRLAQLALRRTYGISIADVGPTYREMRVKIPSAVRLSFAHADGGLVSRDGAPRHFQLAGEDRIFHHADAAVEGDEIVVSCSQVPVPVAVRYAWSNDPAHCNLYNQEGLPAVPFRTDGW